MRRLALHNLGPFSVGLSAALLLGACGSTGATQKNASNEANVLPVVRTSVALEGARPDGVADVVEAVLPSVVSITSTRTSRAQPTGWFGIAGPRQKQQGLGSGVILSASGVVVTNNHVVEGADEVTVRTHDDREFAAKVIGTDPKSDVAVLQLQGQLSDLRPVPVGDSGQLRLGETVLAVGNPFGVGETVTMGIVSAKGRADMGIVDYEDFIQTDAAINPGNSGGALVNLRGELVGINTAILSRSGGSQGIGFAIPTSMAGPIVEALRTEGHVSRGWLGVALQDLNSDLRQAMGLGQQDGVLIADVQSGGPAAKAGLESGDVVVRVGDRDVESTGQFRNLIGSSGAKKSVRLGLLRHNEPLTLDVTLGELPADDTVQPTVSNDSPSEPVVEGLALKPLTPELRTRLHIPEQISGVVIVRVEPGSRAAQARLLPGDLVLEVNRHPATSPSEVRRLYKPGGESQLFVVYRQGQKQFIVVK